MTSKLRGLQLFRQLRRTQISSSSCTSPPPLAGAQPDLLPPCARALSAQPAHDIASVEPRFPAAEPTARQIEHQAHHNLLNALSVALAEAHSGPNRADGHKRRNNRILREFAPLKLVLQAANDEESRSDLRMLEKWEQQLKLEWSTVETLRYKYTEHATNMRKMGRGHSLMGTRSVMNKWFTKLEEAIRQEQEAVSVCADKLTVYLAPASSVPQAHLCLCTPCLLCTYSASFGYFLGLCPGYNLGSVCTGCSVDEGTRAWTACPMVLTYML